jgi:hypothetical protein
MKHARTLTHLIAPAIARYFSQHLDGLLRLLVNVRRQNAHQARPHDEHREREPKVECLQKVALGTEYKKREREREKANHTSRLSGMCATTFDSLKTV